MIETKTHEAVQHARRELNSYIVDGVERDHLEDLVWLRKNVTHHNNDWGTFKKDLEDRFYRRGEYKQFVFKWDTRARIFSDIARIDRLMRLERVYNVTFEIRRDDAMNPYSNFEVYAVEKKKAEQ
ncbi:hypothetical protein KY325_02245 [Candidatus Woesearchaeota archaeon]|nr:hypothetical protein [Candidatus Woesearchaeota archaeon]MBW3017957.1 hypothetical protein [Candidatus Woesearchaeota archaeon]